MIFAVIFLIAGSFLQVLTFLLGFITFSLPSYISTVIETIFGYLSPLHGILPIVADSSSLGLYAVFGLVDVLVFSLFAISALYFYQLFRFLLDLIPFGSSKTEQIKDFTPRRF